MIESMYILIHVLCIVLCHHNLIKNDESLDWPENITIYTLAVVTGLVILYKIGRHVIWETLFKPWTYE